MDNKDELIIKIAKYSKTSQHETLTDMLTFFNKSGLCELAIEELELYLNKLIDNNKDVSV